MLGDRATRLLLVLWLVSLVGGLSAYYRQAVGAYSLSVVWARVLGYHALLGLSASLCVTPLTLLIGWTGRSLRRSAQLRRALGLWSTASALLHVVVGVVSSPLRVTEQLDDPHLRFGLGAFCILLLLAVTSFPTAVQRLHLRSWKELHRLAYVAFVLAVLHGLLAPYACTLAMLGLAVLVSVFGLLRALPRADRPPPE